MPRYTPKNFGVSPPPPVPGGVAPKLGSEKVSRYTGVSQLQLRVSSYTVQLSRSVLVLLSSFLGKCGGLPVAAIGAMMNM